LARLNAWMDDRFATTHRKLFRQSAPTLGTLRLR